MHTQRDTATAILDGGGGYVFTVKNNQPALYTACKKLPWAEGPGRSVTERGHGRLVTRTIKVLDAPAWVEFTGAAQIAQVRPTDQGREQDRGGRLHHHFRRARRRT